MKKIVLSMAGVLAATAFAPEASAIPAFARQTGLACSSCHFQHYPVLSTTGQEFKVGAYTQLSAKGKFKGEDLSIPDNLNGAILLKARYQRENGTDAAGAISGVSKNGGQWQIPDEISLFFGGRIGDNGTVKMGFMNENNLAGSPAIAGFKIPVAIALDPVTVQVIPYMTDALGQAYGFEQSSTGMTRGVRWAEHREETSAAHFLDANGSGIGLGSTAASGIAYVINSDIGYINYSRWSPNFTFAKDSAVQMTSTWLRIAATPTIGDWAAHIAVGVAGGDNFVGDVSGGAPAGKVDTKGSIFDVQLQGSLAEMETSFYFSTMTANKSSATKENYFNASTLNDRKATVIGGDVTVIPHTLTVGLAYRKGTNADAAASANNAVTVTAVYDLFQNVALHADFSKYSGTKASSTYGVGTDYGANGTKSSLLTLMLEAAW